VLEKKFGKHPLSLWRDQSLTERQLEENEGTIFDIIMPWVKEQEKELEKDKCAEQGDLKQKPKGPTQSTLSFAKKTPTSTKTPTNMTMLIQTPSKPLINTILAIE